MTWLLAGLTTLLVSGSIAVANRQSDGLVEAVLRWPLPFPLPPGPPGALILYLGYGAIFFALALFGWGMAFRHAGDGGTDEDGLPTISMLERARAYVSASGQIWPVPFLILLAIGGAVVLLRAAIGDLPADLAVLATVLAVSLIGHAVFEPGLGRPAEPAPAPPPPLAPRLPTLDERLEALKQSEIYRGQIQSVEALPSTAGTSVPVDGDLAAEPLATLWHTASDGLV